MQIQSTANDEELKILNKKAEEGNYPRISDILVYNKIQAIPRYIIPY